MLNFLNKPMLQYTLIDTLILMGVLILAMLGIYSIKIIAVIIKHKYKK